jgi:VIT1/CCC1 family predicted Fe2+/Mn2+ transporter
MIPNHRILLFGVLGSLGLLIVFLVLQGIASFFSATARSVALGVLGAGLGRISGRGIHRQIQSRRKRDRV